MTVAPQSIEQFTHEYGQALEVLAETESRALAIEKRREIMFSEIMNRTEGPVGRAEHVAKASDEYRQVTEEYIHAVTARNIAKAKAKAMEVRWETWRTRNANRRAEMNVR